MKKNQRIRNTSIYSGKDDGSYPSSVFREIVIESFSGPHKLPLAELKKIEKDMKHPTKKPQARYKTGETVYLQAEVEKDGYIIPKYSLCWVEQILIMLEKNEKEKNVYKVHYVLLFEYVNDEIKFNDMFADEEDSFFVRKQRFSQFNFKPAPLGHHIMFSVRESDISDNCLGDTET